METPESMASHTNTNKQTLQSQHTSERTEPGQLSVSSRTVGFRPKTMTEDQIEYVVEELVRQRHGDEGPELEVKWQGWSRKYNTWEPRSHLVEDIPEMVADFDNKPRREGLRSRDGSKSSLKSKDSQPPSRASSTGDKAIKTPRPTQEEHPLALPANWKGWAELENDPLIFSTLLREWGVQGVSLREVIPLDAVFDTPVDKTLGLIFLSRYVIFDQGSDEAADSDKLWFANQISSYSCATVALMNIINNRSFVVLGDDLQAFKDKTIDMSPKDRGLALDNLKTVRDIHNSFATEADKLHVDMRLKDDVKAAAAKKRMQKSKKGRKKLRREVEEDESGLHFVAFVPALGSLWRLDGLEREPTSIGRVSDTDNWLTMVVPILEAQFNAAAINELEFSLLSLVLTEPDTDDVKDQEHMKRVREDWGPMLATLVRIHAEKGDISSKLH